MRNDERARHGDERRTVKAVLVRLVVPALLAVAFTSWHWSPPHGSAAQVQVATVAALDDDGGGASAGHLARGTQPVLPAPFSASSVHAVPVARPRSSRLVVALRARAPPSR